MALGFKDFFHAFGKAMIIAAEEMEKQNNSDQNNGQYNNLDDQYDPYAPIDDNMLDQQSSANYNDCDDEFDSHCMRGTEYEEFNQPVERNSQDEDDPENFEDNQQGENNYMDDFSEDDTNKSNEDMYSDDDISTNNDNQDPDRQGNVRYVPGAHLVCRRQVDDGTYEELWIYNIDQKNSSRSDKIIKNILKGTDIPENEISSDDGSQDYVAWTVGNVQMIKVRGLPE